MARFVHPTAAQNASFSIGAPTVRIGQGPQNDIVLDDDTVSTNHARLDYAEGGWHLTDLGSKNGTYVEGMRLDPDVRVPLPQDSLVSFGALKLRFEADTDVRPDSIPKSVPAAAPTTPRRAGFRLPVWLFLVILIVLAIAVFLLMTTLGDPGINEPSPAVTPALQLYPAEQTMAA